MMVRVRREAWSWSVQPASPGTVTLPGLYTQCSETGDQEPSARQEVNTTVWLSEQTVSNNRNTSTLQSMLNFWSESNF